MDRLNKLQAVWGEDQVSTTAAASTWTHSPKPAHLYEGTDSEDDEEITARGRIEQPQSSWVPTAGGAGAGAGIGGGERISDQQPSELPNHQLQFGELADATEGFCPWQVVKKYPYAHIGVTNGERVAKGFWDEGKLYNRTWDFFYIHRLKSDANQTAILLIPTEQFEAFLAIINRALKLQLTIPSGGGGSAFQVTFENDGTPQPRYLGRSTDKAMADNVHSAVPPSWFKHKGEIDKTPAPSDRSVAAFKAKIDLIAQAQKGRKVVSAEKKKVERIAKQQSWNHTTKRVQRYLGLRKASNETQKENARGGLADSGLEWGAYSAAVEAAIAQSADFSPDKPAPYDQEGEVVFVCVDIESNERNSNQITEIGIATLDTRDTKSVVPGERGVNWMGEIRARHFRIDEYKHIVNTEFISGCPGRFEFGESEFVKLKEAPQAVASCFKHPFSNPDNNAVIDPNGPKRNIILVGHGVGADITYLKTIGYDVHNLSNLQEIVDTALMWQGLKRELSPRNLGSVLAEIDIAGWNLHNAGNDAVYTLQAMIGISIKQLYERQKREEVKEQEKKARVEETIKEATQTALEREEGWSSRGEDSDGGAPLAPVPPGTKKPVIQQSKKGSQYREGPWRAPAPNAGMDSQSQRNDGSWRSAAVSGNGLATSYSSWRQAEPKSSAQTPTLPSSATTLLTGSTPTNIPGSRPTTLPGSNPTPLQGSTVTASWPTYAFPIENMDEAKETTTVPTQTSWAQGLKLPGRTPTRAVLNIDGSKDVYDIRTGKKLFTIEGSTPPPPPPPTQW